MSQYADLSFLKTFTSNDAAKITKYVNMFLNAANPSIVQMKQQLEASDWKSLKTSAHSLKSQLKYMGVASGVEKAFFIENSAGEQQNLDKIPENLQKLEEIVAGASAELRDELAKL
jgi:HPt (histidine-containing phosphotransfer) domain-containing protein